jgi:hypothetical protein
MKNSFRYLAVILMGSFILCLSNLANSQNSFGSKKFETYWYVNASGGLSLFFGDIKQNSIFPANDEINEWRLGTGLMFGRQFSPVFGLRTQSVLGQLSGSKRELGLFIEGSYIEFNLSSTFSLTNLFSQYDPYRKLNFYGVLGLGLTNFDMTQRSLSNNSVVQLSGHGFGKGLGGRTLEGLFLAGLGFDYNLNKKWSLNFETTMKGLQSDKADIYISGGKHDFYNYTSLGVTYKFGYKIRKKDRTPSVFQEDKVVDIPVMKMEEPEEKVVEEVVEKKEPPKKIVTTPVAKKIIPVVRVIPEPEYRVQIRASFGKKLSVEELSDQFKIPVKHIKEDLHQGYYIYTIGSYATYDEAKAKRDKIKSRNGVYDAFIVCFSKGTRLYELPE